MSQQDAFAEARVLFRRRRHLCRDALPGVRSAVERRRRRSSTSRRATCAARTSSLGTGLAVRGLVCFLLRIDENGHADPELHRAVAASRTSRRPRPRHRLRRDPARIARAVFGVVARDESVGTGRRGRATSVARRAARRVAQPTRSEAIDRRRRRRHPAAGSAGRPTAHPNDPKVEATPVAKPAPKSGGRKPSAKRPAIGARPTTRSIRRSVKKVASVSRS